MRPADDRSCPHARARATGSGDDGSHRVRESPHRTSTTSPPTTSAAAPGLAFAARSASEPPAIAPPKMSVARVLSTVPPGTGRLVSRQRLRDQVIGRSHWVFMFGPVGPLKKL